MKIFIMCGGVGKRIGLDIPKALADIGGRTNLSRTIGLLGGISPTVTAPPDKKGLFSGYNAHIIDGDPSKEIGRFTSIIPHLDSEWNILLYGDVVYGEEDIKNILGYRKPNGVVFFERPMGTESFIKKKRKEIVAVGVGNNSLFSAAVNEVLNMKRPKFKGIGWDVYETNPSAFSMVQVSGMTDDYDTAAELNAVRQFFNVEGK